jgi:glycosyltransferase involved in cell wall biosynthesis
MRDKIIIVPAWRRPEFLHVCLERLAACENRHEWDCWVCLDEGHDPQCASVAAQLAPRAVVRMSTVRFARGSSHNTLTAMRDATAAGYRILMLVEDDVWVEPPALEAHAQQHESGAPVVCSCPNQNETAAERAARAAAGVWYYHRSYQSVGSSVSAKFVKLIRPHLLGNYFADMIGYCKRQFPNSGIPDGHAEQDGLIHRIVRREGLHTLYAPRPLCRHAGFIGYNTRGCTIEGNTFLERLEFVRKHGEAFRWPNE